MTSRDRFRHQGRGRSDGLDRSRRGLAIQPGVVVVINDGDDRFSEARLIGSEDVVIDQSKPKPVVVMQPAQVDVVDEAQGRDVDADGVEKIDGLCP